MKKIAYLFTAITLFTGCSKKNSRENIVEIVQQINMEDRFLNFDQTRKEGDAIQGKYYSSADSVKGYTVGYNFVVPDSLKSRTLKIYVSAMVREKELPQQGDLAIVMSNSKGILSWNTVGQFNKKMVPGQWVKLIDSVEYTPENMKDSFIEVGIIGTKLAGSDFFDVDDVNFKMNFIKK